MVPIFVELETLSDTGYSRLGSEPIQVSYFPHHKHRDFADLGEFDHVT